MLKRKRSGNEPLEARLERYKTDLFRALKKVKGFERQRLSRRIHDRDVAADKKQKYELEVAVLKSLDLHQTAFHYLYTSLLKIKAVATHPDLPEEVRKEIPKPELEDAEREALHHVTSCLFNRLEVRQVMDRVVAEVCGVLGVPAPEKKKGKRKGKDVEAEEAAAASEKGVKKPEAGGERAKKQAAIEESNEPKKEKRKHTEEEEEKEQQQGDGDEDVQMDDDIGDMDTDEEEAALAKFDRLLAASSGESDAGADWESESDTGATAQKGRRSIRVRDMSISLSPEPHSGSDYPSDVEISEPDWESEDEPESESESEGERPAKQAKLSKSSKPAERKPKRKPVEIKGSTFVTSLRDAASPVSYSSDSDSDSDSDFSAAPRPPKSKKAKTAKGGRGALPSLMGGYMEGSESASDVDVAPRKKRLGQKQRQAIWEKKFGAKARHIEQQQRQQQQEQQGGRRRIAGGRDDGWDMKRGAVGEEDQRGRGKPWKKGISGPLSAMRGAGAGSRSRGGRPGQGQQQEEERRPRPSTTRDDEGPLHPSWAARKKAKEQAPRITVRPSTANKIVFDD